MLRTSTTHDDYARSVERLLEGGSAVGLTEAQLVERFAGRRDEAAFAALVDRHGPMVLGVCRRFLRDPNDADDAFQAVFLVLARKAGGLRRKELVANWLHGVARRVASEARRRPRPATPGDASAFDADARRPAPAEPSDAAARDEDGRRLHEEVGRLPERYRAPVVVCYFEGRTHEEAAALLNWPVGTVKGRLARARDLLRARLERRGVTAPAALLATALAAPDLRAAVPPALASRAVAAALAVAASPSAWMTSAALSTSARSLSEGVIQAMFYAQLKAIAIPAGLAAGLLAAGAGLATAGREAAQEPTTDAVVAQPVSPPGPTPPDEPRQEFARADLSLSPEEALALIDRTGKAFVQLFKESQIDAVGASGQEMSDAIDRLCDEVDEHVRRLRSAKVADPKGRVLLDAYADSLARLLQVREVEGRPAIEIVQDVEALEEPYLVFRRSANRARLQAAGGRQDREAAERRHRSTMAPILNTLREPSAGPITKPLLAAYADYLEAIDPFAEAPAFGRVAADAPPPEPPAAHAPPAARSVSDALKVVWEAAADYQKSYLTVLQYEPPAGAEEQAAARARHLDRVGRLGRSVRDRAAGDPLLLSLADYLDARSKSPATGPGGAAIPDMALTTIALVRPNLTALLDQARSQFGPQPSEFDRELLREKLAWIRDHVLAESLRLAERDEAARDLLARHAEYVRERLADLDVLFPPPDASAADAPVSPVALTEPAPAPPDARMPETRDPAPATTISDQVALEMTWRSAEQYRKSLDTAMRPAMGKPEDDPKAAEARTRHVERVGRMAEDLQGRSAGEPLLVSLAAFLAADFKSARERTNEQAEAGAIQALSLILMARDSLGQALREERPAGGQELDDFDRSLIRERVLQAMQSTFDDISRQAEEDARARDLLTRFAEALARYMRSDECLSAAQFVPVSPSPASPPAPGFVVAAPSPATPSDGGFGGGFGGPSPGEMRQKVVGLAASLAGVDDDPNNRKAHDALDRPSALKSAGDATLGEVIEQVKKALKAEDGSPIPVYVDPKGLEDADASLDSPVSIDLEGVPLKFSLRLALKQLGLAYCVRDGVLIISSLEGIEQELLEAQRELMGAHPDRFTIDRDGTIRPIPGMSQPGGMM